MKNDNNAYIYLHHIRYSSHNTETTPDASQKSKRIKTTPNKDKEGAAAEPSVCVNIGSSAYVYSIFIYQICLYMFTCI